MDKQVLDNGLRVIYLPIEGVRSASVGIWVSAGSRHEEPQEQGISHFIEHMVFKGTARRSSLDISEEMDSLGGGLNAYTTREYTRYYAQTLGENAAAALDILTDMLMHPLFDENELELERGVILDEMAMYEDSGEDVAHEKLCAAVWPQSSLGCPIAGIPETVSTLTAGDLHRYRQCHYTPERMVVVAAGSYDRAAVTELIGQTLGILPRGEGAPSLDSPGFTPALALTRKKFEQTSLMLSMPGLPYGDERRYALMLLNFIIGGGASSRLFQRLREQLGLAYSIYSSPYATLGTGLFSVSASFSANQQQKVIEEINAVLDEVLQNGITEAELERARAQVKASHIMGLETVASKASLAGHTELFEGREYDSDETLRRLDALTKADIDTLAGDILGSGKRALSVAGDAKAKSFYKPFLPKM